MIMMNIKKTKNISIIFILLSFLLNSCETIERLGGSLKPEIDDSIVADTPDIILPPDFEIRPPMEETNSYSQDRINQNDLVNDRDSNLQNFNQQDYKAFELPQAKNYIAPTIFPPSAKSPSDSIEKFRNNKTFTVGEWVYNQSVNNFKQGNLYYRPSYDKGYNFNRRYTPQNNFPQTKPVFRNSNIYQFPENFSDLNSNPTNEQLLDIEEVPILD